MASLAHLLIRSKLAVLGLRPEVQLINPHFSYMITPPRAAASLHKLALLKVVNRKIVVYLLIDRNPSIET